MNMKTPTPYLCALTAALLLALVCTCTHSSPGTGTTGTHTLTISAAPQTGGTVYVDGAPSTGTSTHTTGTEVTLTAVASVGYKFSGWSGSFVATDAAVTVTLTGNITLTANFEVRETPPPSTTYTLTTSAAPANGGTVSVNGAPSTGTSTHAAGAEVAVAAVAGEGFAFAGWSGASTSLEPSIVVAMGGDRALTANFSLQEEPPPEVAYVHTFAVTPVGGGALLVNGEELVGAGDAAKTLSLDEVATLQLVAEPSVGYEFVGWTFNGSASPEGAHTTLLTNRDYAVVAVFREQEVEPPPAGTYTLTTAASPAGGGTVYVGEAASTGSSTHDAGAEVVVTAVAGAGYKFAGWSGASTSTSAGITVTMNGDKSVTASFQTTGTEPVTFTVTFNANGGTPVPAAQTVSSGEKATAPATAPARTGYALVGWYSDLGLTTAWNFGTDVVTASVTLYAKWEADAPPQPAAFTVTFNANGGTPVPAAQTVSSGGKATAPATAPTRTGYTLGGWYSDVGLTAAWNFGTSVVSDNVMLYAKWESTAPPLGGGTFTDARDSKTYKYAVIGTQTWMAENLNYTKASAGADSSWCYNNSPDSCAKYGRLYNANFAVSACPGGWFLPNNADWKVLIDYAGGNNAGTKLKAASDWDYYGGGTDDYGFSALPGGIRYEGTFRDAPHEGSWWTATTGNGGNSGRRMNSGESFVREDESSGPHYGRSVRCILNPPPTIFTVKFDTQGASPVPAAQTVSRGGTATEPLTVPAQLGRMVVGWSTSQGLNAARWNFVGNTVNDNMTLYAIWENVDVVYVQFNATGGYPSAGQSLNSGSKVSAPAIVPARPGYEFVGWYKDVGLTTAWNFDTEVVNAVVTLYAKWESTVASPPEGGGTFVDARNGQMYRYAVIGGQTWMAENVHFAMTATRTDSSWCGGNNSENCAKYGRLYNWDASKKACPSGWHLPDEEEWHTLVSYAGGYSAAGKKLKSTTGWYDGGNGTDDYGFSALPGGMRNVIGTLVNVGESGSWWSAPESSGWYWYMSYGSDRVNGDQAVPYISIGYSVRCIKD